MVDVIERMLRFSPGDRTSVNDALAHRLFADIRNPIMETIAPGPITLDFENETLLGEAELRVAFAVEVGSFLHREG